MSAKPRCPWLAAMVFMVALAGESCHACHKCKQTPCALVAPPAPAFECVTEMVPCTVMKTKTRVDLVPVCTRTVMETKLELTYDEQVRTACKPMFDTVFQTRCYTVCRPVCETTMVCQPYRVCRPVTTTKQVTEYCLKPYTELTTVPVKTKCGRLRPCRRGLHLQDCRPDLLQTGPRGARGHRNSHGLGDSDADGSGGSLAHGPGTEGRASPRDDVPARAPYGAGAGSPSRLEVCSEDPCLQEGRRHLRGNPRDRLSACAQDGTGH